MVDSWRLHFVKGKNTIPAPIALAWLLAQKPWIVPIPGTTKLNRLEENFRALDISLTADNLRVIEEDVFRIIIQGTRYPEQHQRLTSR